MPTRDLPKRPPDVLPCPECGGKKGHVPGCEAGALQERDYQHERVVALGGRVVRAINLLDRKIMLIRSRTRKVPKAMTGRRVLPIVGSRHDI